MVDHYEVSRNLGAVVRINARVIENENGQTEWILLGFDDAGASKP
jgi:hypothetical protein